MPIQRIDAIYIDFKFHSMPDLGFSDFGACHQWVEAIRNRYSHTTGAPS